MGPRTIETKVGGIILQTFFDTGADMIITGAANRAGAALVGGRETAVGVITDTAGAVTGGIAASAFDSAGLNQKLRD
mgnify:CR=1 FL=1